MSFDENLSNSFKILIFDEKALQKTANGKGATAFGLLNIIIFGIAIGILHLKVKEISLNLILFFWFIFSTYLSYFISKNLMDGKATGIQYFRVVSSSSVILWLTFIPSLGILQVIVGLWLIIVNIYILHKIHKLSIGEAVLMLVVVFLIFFLILSVWYGINLK